MKWNFRFFPHVIELVELQKLTTPVSLLLERICLLAFLVFSAGVSALQHKLPVWLVI